MKTNRRGSLLVAALPVLRAYLRRVAGPQQSTSDLLQEVSLRILSGDGPDDPKDFLAWCCGVARHVLAYDWRMRKRSQSELSLDGDMALELSSRQGDPDSHVDARAFVARAVRRVNSADFDLLVRRYVYEETGKELADGLGQSAAALRMRLMRLRSTLYHQRSLTPPSTPLPTRAT